MFNFSRKGAYALVVLTTSCTIVSAQQESSDGWDFLISDNETFSESSRVAAITKVVRGSEGELDDSGDYSAKKQPPPYIDQLIENAPIDLQNEGRKEVQEESIFNFHQAVEAVFYHQKIDEQVSIQELALGYRAYIPTNNYGDLTIDLVAIDDPQNRPGVQFSESQQQGLSRFSVQQTAFPLSESLSMDNVIGTHRTNRLSARRYGTGLINQRFGAVEPDILGLSTRLNYKHSSITASVGEIGENRGSLLPGFIGLDANMSRLQLQTANDSNSFSADFWNTSDFDNETRNRDGFRGNWSAIWKNNIVSSMNLARSDDSNALLFGVTHKLRELRQEVGLYYFDPDFTWINKRIGDNNSGIYYRMSNRYEAIGYGINLEFREDGIKGGSSNKRDTLFFSANSNYRLNRISRIGVNYAYRSAKQEFGQRLQTDQHLVRANYSKQYNSNTRANIGADYRQRQTVGFDQKDETKRLYSNISHEFLNGSSIEFGLEMSRDSNKIQQSENYRFNTTWNRSIGNNGSISLGTSYNQTSSNTQNNNYWQAQINWNHQLTDGLSVSANIDYNRSVYELEDDINFGGLFTDTEFDQDPFDDSEIGQFTATLRLSYNFGNSRRGSTLSPIRNKSGSGSIRGRLFFDENNDGIKQLNEPGISGVSVYLDSVHPTTSNTDGSFDFQRVGSGEHQIFIDERRLPLPYHLNGTEYTPVLVRLRKVNNIDIPVHKLP